MKLEELVQKIETSIVEIANSNVSKMIIEEASFSLWDGHIKKVWPKLINPPLVYLNKSKEEREKCKWTPPLKDWVKLNFDGVARGNLGVAGIGCIINDHTSWWTAKKS